MDQKVMIKGVGIILTLASIVIFMTMFWFLGTLSDLSEESCTCGDFCEMVHYEIPSYFYVGMAAVALIFVLGVILIFKAPDADEGPDTSNWLEQHKKLDGDEATIYKILIDAGGTMFQSDIVEKTDLSKVKITRVLDKLESRNLAERRRRGLTNIVVLIRKK